MTVLSADWVLPVSGEPIADGAVSIEAGRIAAVGTQAELGRGTHYPDAAIVPGFVNAHSHLEYAVYAGFGDGLPFAPWILIHIERKDRLTLDDMVDIARLGAAESLRSGVTTVGDASYSGAAATACAELGLRAVVYLEVFGKTTEQLESRFAANRDRIGGALSDRVRLGVSPHAPYSVSPELYAACLDAGPARGDAPRGEPRRGSLAALRRRALGVDGGGAAGSSRHKRDPHARRRRPARPEHHGGALRHRRRGGDRPARRARRGGGALSALERLPRLRHRAADGDPRGRRPDGPRHRLARLDAVLRPVRRAAVRRLRGAVPRSGAPTRSPRPTRSSSRRSDRPARSAWRRRSAASSPANTPTWPSSHSRAARIFRGRIRPPPSSSAGRPTA